MSLEKNNLADCPNESKDKILIQFIETNGQFEMLSTINLSDKNQPIYLDENKKLNIITDRLGVKHLYIGQSNQGPIIGDSFLDIANKITKKEKDWLAIAHFFTFGFFIDDQTYYKNIKILKPARHYIFDKTGKIVSSKRYFNWNYQPDHTRSYKDTIDEFARIFHEVISEQIKGRRVAFPISGGLDSRSTIAALMNIENIDKTKLWSYSYGYSDNSVETCIAKEIAEVVNLTFQKYTIEPYLFDKLDNVLKAVEGFQDITQCRQAYIVEELAKQANYVMCAHWGDVWLDASSQLPVTDNQGLVDLIYKKFKKKGSEWLVENVCRKHIGNINVEDIQKAWIEENLKEYDHIKDLDFKIKAFKTDTWSFRWTLTSIRVFQEGTKPLLLFYNDRLVDFFCTVPSEYLQGRKLQIDYIKKYAPELAKVKWEVYDSNLYQYQHFNSWQIPKRIFKKIYLTLFAKKIIQRNWEIQFLNLKGHRNLESCLLKNQEASEQNTKKLIKAFYDNPTAENGYTVSMLLTSSNFFKL